MLKKVALLPNDTDSLYIQGIVELEPDRLSTAAAEAVKYLIEHYSRFQVRTIDSFVNSIAKAASFEIGIAPEFDVETDRGSYLKLALDRLIDRLPSDRRLTGAFIDFVEQDLADGESWHVSSPILSTASNLLDKEASTGRIYEFLSVEELNRKIDELRRLTSKLVDYMKAHPDDFNKNALKALKNFADGNAPIPGSVYFFKPSVDDLIKKNHGPAPDEIRRLYNRIRETAEDVLYIHASARLFHRKKLLDVLREELQALKQRNRVIFVEDINLSVRRLLMDMEIPEIFFKIGETIDHFLIDEFQDTSILQWENLFLLIENALARGGSLFVVGDQKQMIYRFRGSEPGIFSMVFESFANVPDEDKRVFDTTYNWRSRKAIVEFNNRIYSIQNILSAFDTVEMDESLIASTYRFNEQEVPEPLSRKHEGGFVQVRPVKTKNREEVKDEFMNLMAELLERHPASRIAVLVRKHDDGELISSWLMDAGIPVISARTLDIRTNPSINNLIAFLKFLNMPIDDVSFAATITGPAFLRAAGLTREHIIEWLERQRDNDAPLYRAFREEFNPIWQEFIEPFFKSVGYLPTYDLTREIVFSWRLFEDNAVEGAVFHLLELIHRLEERGEGDLSSFLNFLESDNPEPFSIRFPEEFEGVRIMTVHASKGLEFPVVVIPFVGLSSGKNRGTFVEDIDEDRLRLLKIDSKSATKGSRLAELYIAEKTKSKIDELNLLYVATTRAIDELHIIVGYSLNENGRVNEPFARLLLGESPAPIVIGEPVRHGETGRNAPRYYEWRPESGIAWHNSLVRQQINLQDILHGRLYAIRRGELVHGALARIKWLPESESEIASAIKAAVQDEIRARNWFEFSDEISNIVEQVTYALLDSGAIRWFRREGNDMAFAEYEIVDRTGRAHRIDRLVIRGGNVEVIEFKTGEEYTHEHLTQVITYLRLVRALFPNKNVTGHIFYIDESHIIDADSQLLL